MIPLVSTCRDISEDWYDQDVNVRPQVCTSKGKYVTSNEQDDSKTYEKKTGISVNSVLIQSNKQSCSRRHYIFYH